MRTIASHIGAACNPDARTIELNTGARMPAFGTGSTHNEGGIRREHIELNLRIGVRLIDTAKRYGSERAAGAAVRAAEADGVCARSDVWVNSKLWPGDVRGAGSVARAYEASVAAVGLGPLDSYLVHWPGSYGGGGGGDPQQARLDTWRQSARRRPSPPRRTRACLF